jgi:hypothetical protein
MKRPKKMATAINTGSTAIMTNVNRTEVNRINTPPPIRVTHCRRNAGMSITIVS